MCVIVCVYVCVCVCVRERERERERTCQQPVDEPGTSGADMGDAPERNAFQKEGNCSHTGTEKG